MNQTTFLLVATSLICAGGICSAGEPAPHWSFCPVQRSAVPTLRTSNPKVCTPIDRFILARLEREGLTLSAPADRVTLIRRLKFDLLGLPPTPEEVESFVRDQRPDAYERLVDRYLASPHFGERWARHWLDVVRFAESDGFETNIPRANAWPYRDWVIRALNEDMPYDRFIREQLAGDQFGVDAATGFLVAGAVDRVKSPDPVLTAMQRADELHDIVSTTASAFLGLTAGCARCHDHKFDPISQNDYYALKAVFEGVQHGERRLRMPDDGERERRIAELRREVEQLTLELESLQPLAQPGGPVVRMPVNARRNVERLVPTEVKFVRFTILGTNNLEPCIDELELFTPGGLQNVALGAKPTSSGDYSDSPEIHQLPHINDGRYGNSRSWISNQIGAGWVQLELKEPATIDRIVWARDREGKFADRLAVKYRIEVALRPGEWRVVATSDDRLPFGSKEQPAVVGANLARYQTLLAERNQKEKEAAALQRSTMVYAGNFTTPVKTYRLHRGDPMQPREPVAPAGIVGFGEPIVLTADAAEAKRRLELANWIANPKHPLTARVMVNRLWQHHFGTGLVDTPSDFGRNGSKPSHPELLDWLADELVRGGWHLKPIHRLIVLSATYQQSSAMNEKGKSIDAASRLLWRYPPRRLDAEPLRDAILAVSGNLDRRMGGPGFDLFEPNSNYVHVYNPKQTFGPAEWRRMIYQQKPRMQLDDTFGAFDCPDGGQIAPRRNRSTTALQALNLLNSPFIMQQSRIFAERVQRGAGADIAEQVRRAFQLALQRDADTQEQPAAERLVREHGLPSLCRALLNTNEFVMVR